MEKDAKVIKTPAKYQGKWVAWNHDHSAVIASGNTLSEAKMKAMKKAEHFWLDKIPSEKDFFAGAATMR